ncbi:hypothetical protein I302_100499 [Kwoniella bestiolae CBS 10118]|uniref:Prolyl endopeptidase n=1 Tax=Kwoniella bestiolae CBS 10118 TaxID=1296100 RepID=A0A1B9G585_9TREE|nr:hypothetical protein I302_03872 [Kwoniella bestiolae CBS 10118]OCF26194.1 hypothetical protein I302_03872 [Kwoniella bestiolae CBS 10118]
MTYLPGASISKTPHGALTNQPTTSFTVSKSDWGHTPKQFEITYPIPPQDGGVTEEIFGLKVEDPWRTLENLDNEVTRKFVKDQNKLSVPILTKHPLRHNLEEAVEGIYNHSRMDTPQLQADGYYYWNYNKGNWARDILVRSKSLDEHFGKDPLEEGGPEVFFDLNKQENTSMYAHGFSASGKLWAVVLQISGSDWQTIKVYDTTTKQPVDVDVGGSKFTFGATWIGEEGYIYKRIIGYNGSDSSLSDGSYGMFYHRIGQPQSTDIAVLPFTGEFHERFVGKAHTVSSDQSASPTKRTWLTFDIYRNTNPETELLVVELPGGPRSVDGETIERLVREERKWVTKWFTGETRYIGSTGLEKHFFYSTADGHPTGRIVTFDTEDWDRTPVDQVLPLKEFVAVDPEGHQLHNAQVIGSKLLMLIYLKHACASVTFYNALTGRKLGFTNAVETKGNIELDPNTEVPVPEEEFEISKTSKVIIPEHGSIKPVSSRFDSPEFYFAVDTWVAPSYVLRGKVVDTNNDEMEVDISSINVVDQENKENIVCNQVFYGSNDGTKIPLFICHLHDLDLTKPQPTLLHAYGGFCAPMIPHYDALFASFMRNLRGIVAIAGIRGGGEYGKRWHDAAKGIKKSVAWDDFSCAAKYLQSKGLTTPALTAIYGTSNGGLLVTACANRTPELFNTVFADVAITDLVRYHKFTLGRMWLGEYGSPEIASDFPVLLRTSPLHNIRTDVTYPSILVTTADHDDRVVPGHSLKYLAEVQSKHLASEEGNMILGRLYENAGHELSAKSLEKKVEEVTDRLIFTLLTMRPQIEL